MYEKVSTDLNFVEREKATEKFWKEQSDFSKKVWKAEKKEKPIPFMMDHQLQMENHILVMFNQSN
jgi:hypothetical protein